MSSPIPPAILARREELHRNIAETSNLILADPDLIARAEGQVVTAKQQLEELKSQLELADAELYEDEAYQKASNDAKRKTALAKLRADSDIYRSTAREVAAAEGAVKQADIEVRKAENDFRAHQRRLTALGLQVQLYWGPVIE